MVFALKILNNCVIISRGFRYEIVRLVGLATKNISKSDSREPGIGLGRDCSDTFGVTKPPIFCHFGLKQRILRILDSGRQQRYVLEVTMTLHDMRDRTSSSLTVTSS